jgi:D-beta-D-heptose 7-phosphate kinase/D-beta-D-heptose 1-phosphate adenosyltransferase
VVVVSDYLKGAVTQALVAAIVKDAGARKIPVLVDPKIPHIDYYEGATVVTPNHHEAETATHMRIRSNDDAKRAAKVFLDRARCQGVLITRGEHGMSMLDPAGEAHYPTVAREVADVTGAGDTVIAALALGLAAGAALAEAAQLANHAAGIVVGRFGPATVSPAELLAEFGDHRTHA